jgi:hypothetical protein
MEAAMAPHAGGGGGAGAAAGSSPDVLVAVPVAEALALPEKEGGAEGGELPVGARDASVDVEEGLPPGEGVGDAAPLRLADAVEDALALPRPQGRGTSCAWPNWASHAATHK